MNLDSFLNPDRLERVLSYGRVRIAKDKFGRFLCNFIQGILDWKGLTKETKRAPNVESRY